MATNQYLRLQPSKADLQSSAGFPATAAGSTPPVSPMPAQPNFLSELKATLKAAESEPAASCCEQVLRMAFFFDGTGNNLKADEGTREHSNVARLFNAHPLNDENIGIYAFYIPGIGTYFKDIGDPGQEKNWLGVDQGLAFGTRGQARLDWAMQQFKAKIKVHEARAKNPTNKIRSINVSVFGFSRGSALARAFCRDLQKMCSKPRNFTSKNLNDGGYPLDINFLGIFDTVASVGIPMSGNNTTTSDSTAAAWYNREVNIEKQMQGRNGQKLAASDLAFGEPGADPAPGSKDGHMDWADGLTIPPLVSRCVHMVAAHEIRNSFPLDSALAQTDVQRGGAPNYTTGAIYPESVTELAFPGAHSDVGGGYRPGDGGRATTEGNLLSLIPLREMHAYAVDAGVPLIALGSLTMEKDKKDFALDKDGKAAYEKLLDRYQHYIRTAGASGHLGKQFNAHMRLFFAWRFQDIRKCGTPGVGSVSETAYGKASVQFEADRVKLTASVAQQKAALDAAQLRFYRASNTLLGAEQNRIYSGIPVSAAVKAEHAAASETLKRQQDAYLSEKAKLDTLPGGTAHHLESLHIYDRQLLEDIQSIKAAMQANPKLKLRPHYRNLVEAYDAEFVQQNGLKDGKIIEFFDLHVHDSLAGFATDATLPSDPRVIYASGDTKFRFAQRQFEPALESEPLMMT